MTQTIHRPANIYDSAFIHSRKLAQDERLSYAERGILAYLLSKPPDWEVRVDDLLRGAEFGRDKMYGYINHLIELGYMMRVQERDAAGRIRGTKTHVLANPNIPPFPDQPDTAEPDTAEPDTAEPDTAGQDTYIRERVHKRDTHKREEEHKRESTPPPGGGGAVFDFLLENGIFLSPFLAEQYLDLIDKYSEASVLRGMAEAAKNSKLGVFNYVVSCTHNIHHDTGPGKQKDDAAWTADDLSGYAAINR